MAFLAIVIVAVATSLVAPATQAPAEDVAARMQRYNRSLGVECVHCHVDGQWTDDTKRPFAIARNMSRMVTAVNERLGGEPKVSCFTCHGGSTRPARQPGDAFDAELARWPADLAGASQGLRITMSVYNVALGVGCDHCHVPGEWANLAKAPNRIVPTMNSLFEIFPSFMPESARTQCYMCHKGSTKPALVPPPDLRTFGPSDLRTFGPSDPRTFGPSDPRTFGPPSYLTYSLASDVKPGSGVSVVSNASARRLVALSISTRSTNTRFSKFGKTPTRCRRATSSSGQPVHAEVESHPVVAFEVQRVAGLTAGHGAVDEFGHVVGDEDAARCGKRSDEAAEDLHLRLGSHKRGQQADEEDDCRTERAHHACSLSHSV